jgi:hypothetical protein
MTSIVHFVRFAGLHCQRYANAARVFGEPAMMHRRWDRRALRDVAPGDVVVFAKGEADQSMVEHNGDDEFYDRRPTRGPHP